MSFFWWAVTGREGKWDDADAGTEQQTIYVESGKENNILKCQVK